MLIRLSHLLCPYVHLIYQKSFSKCSPLVDHIFIVIPNYFKRYLQSFYHCYIITLLLPSIPNGFVQCTVVIYYWFVTLEFFQKHHIRSMCIASIKSWLKFHFAACIVSTNEEIRISLLLPSCNKSAIKFCSLADQHVMILLFSNAFE